MKAIGGVQANTQQSINDQVGGDAISLHPLGCELQLGIWVNHPRLLSHSSAPFRRCASMSPASTGYSAVIAPASVPVPSSPPAPVRAQGEMEAAENYSQCWQTV